MKYPKKLLQNNRNPKDSHKIRNHHWVYQRFPPALWKSEDEYPDFNQIKLDQSFNWSAYSIAEWVRFKEINNEIVYNLNQGVCGYKIGSIRKIELSGINEIVDIEHKPISYNYSHCELISLKPEVWNKDKKNKKNRRKIKIKFKHFITILLRQNEELSSKNRLKNIIKMYCDKCY